MVFTTLEQVLRQFVPVTDQNDKRDKGDGGEGMEKRRGMRKKGVTEGEGKEGGEEREGEGERKMGRAGARGYKGLNRGEERRRWRGDGDGG
jgi:hypothetical protein